jgi:uncharacterized protein (DUF362 family)
MKDLTRRELLKLGAGTCLALGTSPLGGCGHGNGPATAAGRSIVHTITGDEFSDLYRMGARAAQALGINAGHRLSGARVFIKPNLVSMGQGFYVPTMGACTKVEILVGIAEQCLLAGADRVTIGDGAHTISWNWNTLHFFPGNTIHGTENVKDAVDHLKAAFPNQEVELACINALNEWECIPSASDHELMQDGLPIGRRFYEADHVISVPVIKTHIMADVTLAMKNYIGIVSSMPPFGYVLERQMVHEAYANTACGGLEKAGIAACFTDICKWRQDAGKEDFAIIDCSLGVEGQGPIPVPGAAYTVDFKERTPAGKYFLLASRNLAAADAAAVRVMNQDIYSMKQLVLAKNRNLGEIDNIDISGDVGLDQLIVEDWRRATIQLPEWGVAATMPCSARGTARTEKDRLINTLAGLAGPAGVIYGLRRWHQKHGQPEDGRELLEKISACRADRISSAVERLQSF